MNRKVIKEIKHRIREITVDMNDSEYIEILMELSTWARDEALKTEYGFDPMDDVE